MAIAWGTLTASIGVVFVALRTSDFVEPAWTSLAAAKVGAAIWPILAAGTLVLPLRVHPPLRERLGRIRIPAGDIVVPLTSMFTYALRIWSTVAVSGAAAFLAKTSQHLARFVPPLARDLLNCVQYELENDLASGLLIGLLAVAMFALLIL
jgi:hypothetical protein